jgi:hypothetical protein
MGSSGSSSSSTPAWQSKEIRFSPYIESRHVDLLATTVSYRISAIAASPYTGYTDLDYNSAIIGIGYTITSFPSLYDMFGKFMSGFDVEVLWGKAFDRVINSTGVDDEIDSEITTIDEAIEAESIPELKLLARDTNIVCSSSFIIGKALIESNRIKTIAKISEETKSNLLQETVIKSNSELNWQKIVIDNYAELFKLYYLVSLNCTDVSSKMAGDEVMWPFTVLDFERAVLGTMHQRTRFNKSMKIRKRSRLSRVLGLASAAVTGAGIGASFGGPYGALIGAAIGYNIGIVQQIAEIDRWDLLVPTLTFGGPYFDHYSNEY